MRERKAIRRWALALGCATVLGLGACGGTEATSARDEATVSSAREMQGFLEEARSAAATYGRKHLGHYLDLDVKRLRKQNLDVPPGVTLEVTTDHNGYCLLASSNAMARADKWASATVSSDLTGVSASDRCTA